MDKVSHAPQGKPWVWGEPDMAAPFIGADTEYDSMDANDVGAVRAGYSLSDGTRGIFKTDEPHIRHGSGCCRQLMPGRVFLHSAKADLRRLNLDPDDLDSWDDTLLMAYCLRRFERLGLKTLAPYLTDTHWPVELKDLLKYYTPSGEVFKSGPRKGQEKPGKWTPQVFSKAVETRWEDASRYAATDAVATSRLAEVLTADFERAPGAKRYYETFEKPLVPALLQMEETGLRIDTNALWEASDVIDEKRRVTEETLARLFPGINPGSSQQVGPLLYELGIVDGSLTENGQIATGKPAILAAFRADRVEEIPDTETGRIAKTYLTWKQMGKLRSTYVNALLDGLDANGRIHPRFNSAATVTNRLSSSNPNFQNIPTRTKEGAAIRKAVVPGPGNVFVGGDYSQLQLRVFAEMTGEPVFVNAYTKADGIGDFHQYAADHLQRPRSIIKSFVFAVLFGASPAKAAMTAGVPQSQAAAFMNQLHREIPSLVTWQSQTQDLLSLNGGWVESMMGWRMVYPDYGARNNRKHAAAIREASNGRIQASEAGLVKAFLIELYSRLRRYFPRWRLVLTVHDEVWAEGPENEAAAVGRMMTETSADVAARWFKRVPIVFSVKDPLTNWAQAKD